MNMFANKPFRTLITAGVLALAAAAAAQAFTNCSDTCQYYAQQAYTSTKANAAAQQTAYCNTLTDQNAKNSCLASVPYASEAQGQAAYNQVLNSCSQSCHM